MSATPQITNADFLTAIFGPTPSGEYLWTTHFRGCPKKATGNSWGGSPVGGRLPDYPEHNTYFSVARVCNGSDAPARRKANFVSLHCVVVDDAAVDECSWQIETSYGNYQTGFILDTPISDCDLADRIHKDLAKAGKIKNDKSGNNVVRYVRLPVGSNGKTTPPFPHHLVKWNEGRKFSLDQIIALLGLDADHIKNAPRTRQNRSGPANGGAGGAKPLPSIERVGSAMAHLCAHNITLFSDYNKWVDIGLALSCYKGTPDEEDAAKFFITASRLEKFATDKTYDKNEADRKWRGLEATDITPATILHHARKVKEPKWIDPETPEQRRQRQRDEARAVGMGLSKKIPIIHDTLTVAEMLDRFVLIADGSRVYDLESGEVLPLHEARVYYASSKTEIVDNKGTVKRVLCLNLWVADHRCMKVSTLTWAPAAEVICHDPNDKPAVNTWKGFKKFEGPRSPNIDLFTDHIAHLFKDRADDFLQWLAHIKQHPGVLPHRGWLHISSNTGTGRNAIGLLLSKIFAGYCAPSIDLPAILDGGFNGDLSEKVLAIVDEIQEGGSEKWRHADRFKSLLTASHRTINKKYGRMVNEFNCCRFLLFSNHRNAIPIDSGDRRLEVVVNDYPPLGADYFRELYDAIGDDRFVAAVSDFLDNYDISGFRPGDRPKMTEDRAQVVNASMHDQLHDLRNFSDHYPFEIATADRFRQAAGISAEDVGNNKGLSRFIISSGWEKVARPMIDGELVWIYARRGPDHEKWRNTAKEKRTDGLSFGRLCKQFLPVQDGGLLAWDGVMHEGEEPAPY